MLKPNRLKRKRKIRSRIWGSDTCPRVVVYKSNTHIYAQMINDDSSKTLNQSSDVDIKDKKATKIDKAKKVGLDLGQKAIKAKILQVVFDRGGYKYHGRVKALADGLREAGLKV